MGNNFVFAQFFFNLQCQYRFFDFTCQRFFATVQICKPCKLLSDGTAALYNFAGLEVCYHSTADTNWVNALMLTEALVFNGNQSVDDIWRNLVIFYRNAVFTGMEITNLYAIFIKYSSGYGIAVQIDTVQIRSIFGDAKYSTCHDTAPNDTAHNDDSQKDAQPMNFIFYFFLFRFLRSLIVFSPTSLFSSHKTTSFNQVIISYKYTISKSFHTFPYGFRRITP